MKNVHIGWGPVGMSKIGGPSRPKLQLNKINYTGEIGSGFKLEIISKYEEPPVWQSSNENVAIVDQDGSITLVNEGTAVITVTSGKLTGRCTIKVVLSAEQEFLRDIEEGNATLLESITKTVVISNDTEIKLNGNTLTGELFTEQNGEIVEGNTDSVAIWAKEGSNVEIEGVGEVRSQNATYSMAVWAQGGDVTIKGGSYYNEGDGCDLIYASAGGNVYIYGGEFHATGRSGQASGTQNAFSALNVKDADYKSGSSKIVVYGGKFYGFDPANNLSEGPNTNFVAEGYESKEVESGVWEVTKKPETPEEPETSKLNTSKIYYGTIPFSDYENVITEGLHQIDEDLILKSVNSGSVLLADLKADQLFEVSHKAGDIIVVLMANYNAYIKNPLGEDLFEFADANGMQEIEGFKLFGELANNTANTLIYVK